MTHKLDNDATPCPICKMVLELYSDRHVEGIVTLVKSLVSIIKLSLRIEMSCGK